MNTTQERVRNAMRATAAQVQAGTMPPLDLTPAAERLQPGGPRPGQRGWTRLLAPVAAAASVAAIAAAAVAISQRPAATGGTHPPPGSLRSWPVGVSKVVPPPYYVALTQTNVRWRCHPLDVTVRSTATGRVLATLTPPKPYTTFSWVSGAADDRTFVLAANKLLVPGGPYQGQHSWPQSPVRFYLLRFRPAGDATQLTELPITDVTSVLRVGDVALSPDGAYLAVALGGRKISVYSVRSGAERTWSMPAAQARDAYLGHLSWTADDQTIAFSSSGLGPQGSGPGPTAPRLLDTGTAGGDLLADSRPVPISRSTGLTCYGGIITLSGSALVCPATKTPPKVAPGLFSGHIIENGFAVFSTRTGQVLRRLGSSAALGQRPELLWVSPSGRALIANLDFPGPGVVIVRQHGVVPIPWASEIAFGQSPFPLPAW
ncbi:MAG TPA: hypothetical protein VF834_13575 [Streptosporangiaceae bacterium]